MAQMCVLCHSLYNCKECDGCGKCDERYDDDWDERGWEADREEAAAEYYSKEQ